MWKAFFSKRPDVQGQAPATQRPARRGAHGAETALALAPDTDMNGALLHAATRGDLARAEALLKAGLDLEARDCAGRTALMLAAQGGHAAVVHALLAAGAQPDARDARNWSALMIAAQAGRPCIVRALANAGVGLGMPG